MSVRIRLVRPLEQVESFLTSCTGHQTVRASEGEENGVIEC